MKSTAKRRRTKEEIKLQKLEEEKKQQDIDAKLQRFNQLEQQVSAYAQKQSMMEQAQATLENLNASGLIRRDAQGHFEAVNSIDEQQQILQRRQEEEQLA